MIKYTTSDIIRRAEQIADLENSDFISTEEKCALLNENWTALYNKIIGANDKVFIKSLFCYDGMRLPQDFYQLAALYTANSKTQIVKKNASKLSGYELRNGCFYLSEDLRNEQIIMEYFPVPKTLFFNDNKKQRVALPSVPSVIVDEDFILDINNNVYDLNTGFNTATVPEQNLILKCKNGYISNRTFYSYNNEIIEQKQNEPFVIKGDVVTYDDIESDADLTDVLAVIMDNAQNIVFYLKQNNAEEFQFNIYNENMEDTGAFINSNNVFYCRENGLYIATPGTPKIIRIFKNVSETFPLNMSTFCAFNGMHSMIIKRGEFLFKQGYGVDTLLEYPNNIYYILLSYALAISFKLKQNGDINGINVKYNEALAQFYESLSNDANDVVQMKNVYRRGTRLW